MDDAVVVVLRVLHSARDPEPLLRNWLYGVVMFRLFKKDFERYRPSRVLEKTKRRLVWMNRHERMVMNIIHGEMNKGTTLDQVDMMWEEGYYGDRIPVKLNPNSCMLIYRG